MAIRTILDGGNTRLRAVCRPVKKINQHIIELLEDMSQTMYDARGVGLAAPQVGVMRRVVVIDVGDGLIELINPEIVSEEGQQRCEEGCLSFPNENGYVIRPEKIVVKALDRNGEEHEYVGTELFARALAHEIDHLDGVLFVDKVVEWINDDDEEETGDTGDSPGGESAPT